MKKIQNYYEFHLDKYKTGHKAVNWGSKKAQETRFEKIIEIADLKDSSLLDIGCGLGHFLQYLDRKKIRCSYKGTDISGKMIHSARKLNFKKKSAFYDCDILNKKKNLNFLKSDYVINCGLFTVKSSYTNEQWWSFVRIMLVNMFKLSKKGIAFNLLTDNVDYREKHLFYASQKKIINFAINNLNEKIICRRNPKVWENVFYVYK
jgi:SAM-dependent methyltransferase